MTESASSRLIAEMEDDQQRAYKLVEVTISGLGTFMRVFPVGHDGHAGYEYVDGIGSVSIRCVQNPWSEKQVVLELPITEKYV